MNNDEKVKEIMDRIKFQKNEQNNVDSIIKQEQKEQDIIEKIQNDNYGQKDVNSLIEKEKQVLEMASKIVQDEYNQDDINKVVEQTSEIEYQKETEEEQNYMNSYHYNNYLIFIQNLDTYVNAFSADIINKLLYNETVYRDSLARDINSNIVFNNIGFPVPKKFLQIVINKVNEKN